MITICEASRPSAPSAQKKPRGGEERDGGGEQEQRGGEPKGAHHPRDRQHELRELRVPEGLGEAHEVDEAVEDEENGEEEAHDESCSVPRRSAAGAALRAGLARVIREIRACEAPAVGVGIVAGRLEPAGWPAQGAEMSDETDQKFWGVMAAL
jgi:hypothetical protein